LLTHSVLKFPLKDMKTISPWILQLHSALFQIFHISGHLWKPELNRNLRNSICSRNTFWISKNWVNFQKRLYFEAFSSFTKFTHVITYKQTFLLNIYKWFAYEVCKPKDKYSRAILGSWSWFTGPSDGLKDYDIAGSFREPVVWCSIPRLS
jgi:hypothetical protein